MEVYTLRCTHCGAPLPKPSPGEDWVKCEYCSYVNKLVDASRYVDNLKRELEKWIREILPPTMTTSTTIDVAARYQIFQNLIKPRVSLTRANVRAKYLQYLSLPITPLLITTTSFTEEPKRFFEEALKVESLKDFAVTEEDQKMLNETLTYEMISGYISNALKALGRNDVKAALKNAEEALQAIPKAPEFSLVEERLRAVHSMLSAVNEFWNRNTRASHTLIRSSVDLYKALLQRISNKAVPEVSPGIIEIERICAESLANIIDSAHRLFTVGEDPLRMMEWFERYVTLFNKLRETYKRPVQDLLEVTSYVRSLIYSKTGLSEVNVVRGSGMYYVPYYVVEAKFSYVKGFILKKGAESSMKLMVAGIAPYVRNPVTDVLGIGTGRLVPPDKVEEAPALALINELNSRKVRTTLSPGLKALPPLISSVHTEKLTDSYITDANNYYRGKITFASTSVRELLYIPFTRVNGGAMDFEGKLRIQLSSDAEALERLAI